MRQKQLTVLIKPASGLCQMSCGYCFYRDLEGYGAPVDHLMSEDTENLLLDRIQAYGATQVQLAFQGGEPLLWGYDRLASFCAKVSSRGWRATYALQTNGLAVNEAFCRLFARYDFLVGLSLDGDEDNHDFFRTTHGGEGTFDRVKKALTLLKRHGVRHNILTVITPRVAKHPAGLYRFYRRLGVSHVQLIPCLPPVGNLHASSAACVPTQAELTSFFLSFYRLWREGFAHGKPPFSVREFDQSLQVLNGRGDFCGSHGYCTPQLIVEADGSLYPCDFYVLPPYQTGHLATHTLEETLQSDGMAHFVRTHPTTHESCRRCKYLPVCGGGCRRMRDVYLSGDDSCPLQALYDYMIEKERRMI